MRVGAGSLIEATHHDPSETYRSSFVGNTIMARALLAAALSNDLVKLRLQLHKRGYVRQNADNLKYQGRMEDRSKYVFS